MVNHAIAFYGTTRYKAKVKVTYKQRYLKKRKDGVRQHYTKKVTAYRTKNLKGGQRLTIWGSVEDVKEAKRIIDEENLIPIKRYEDRISAEIFVRNPAYRRKHTRKGKWIAFEEDES